MTLAFAIIGWFCLVGALALAVRHEVRKVDPDLESIQRFERRPFQAP